MRRGQRDGSRRIRRGRRTAAGRVRSPSVPSDGTRLHAEVFGPEDGYPIVLAHGITCAIRVWAYQIADLATDYRVIAYDHRGHGRSGVPPRAPSLQPQLPGRRPRRRARGDAGPGRTCRHRRPFDGRHRDHLVGRAVSRRVPERADAVALINTTTGDLLRHVQLLPVPAPLADAQGAYGGDPAEDVRRRAAAASGGSAEPAVRLRRSRWAETPTRTSPNSSTSCSPRHRPRAAAAGPAPWSTRSAPSTST